MDINNAVKKSIENGFCDPKSIIDYLQKNGHSIHRVSLSRILSQGVEDGWLVAEGHGKSRKYDLSGIEKIEKWLEKPTSERTTCGYRRSFLENYIPNETKWFSEKQISKLERAQPEIADVSTYSLNIAKKLMVDLSHASSALEGNTYSWLETEHLLLDGVVAEGKTEEETIMVLNHKNAVNFVTDLFSKNALYPYEGPTSSLIRSIHALLSEGLIHNKDRGQIRKNIVGIGGSSYVPEGSPHILEETLNIICEKVQKINCPFESSLFLLVNIPYLQPFIDVNKRTGRLAANLPLLAAGKAPLSFTGVSPDGYVKGLLGVYELNDPSLIAKVYTEGYIKMAHHYSQGIQSSPEDIAFFAQFRNDIKLAIEQHGISWESGLTPTAEETVEKLYPENPQIAAFVVRYVESFAQNIAELDRYSTKAQEGLKKAKEHLKRGTIKFKR